MIKFNPDSVKNFHGDSWAEYGKDYQQLMIDLDDVEDADLLVELPAAVAFIDKALTEAAEKENSAKRGVFVHCVAGKSRSVSVIIAYLLWKYPQQFDPAASAPPNSHSRKSTAKEAVANALELIRKTRPMAYPNHGFREQLSLWWTMGCPQDVEGHPMYQRWAYQREVAEHLAVGQAPSRVRFEDEHQQQGQPSSDNKGSFDSNLRCKKCRKILVTSGFVQPHRPLNGPGASCPHFFIEPLSWMRTELSKGDLNGRLSCPNPRCGASVGRYDWKGFKCACGDWITPAFSLQRARVDEERNPGSASAVTPTSLGIRMPPGSGSSGGGGGNRGGGNL